MIRLRKSITKKLKNNKKSVAEDPDIARETKKQQAVGTLHWIVFSKDARH